MIFLDTLNKKDILKILEIRKQYDNATRESFPLTKENQLEFYEKVVCNKLSNSRYFSVIRNSGVIGMAALTNIELENRCCEIGILTDKNKKGYGEDILKKILDKAFLELNLNLVYGECFTCNPALKFWINNFNNHMYLPERKYYKGDYYDILYFYMNRGEYYERMYNPSENDEQ
jgi:hypothetical protein